jgi:hypothetical protein
MVRPCDDSSLGRCIPRMVIRPLIFSIVHSVPEIQELFVRFVSIVLYVVSYEPPEPELTESEPSKLELSESEPHYTLAMATPK